jgi:hypothetical protein
MKILIIFAILVLANALNLKGLDNNSKETSTIPRVRGALPEPSIPSVPTTEVENERPQIFLGAADAPYTSGYITNYHTIPPGSI